MIRLIQSLLTLGIVGTISAILVIVGGYIFFKPSLPEIELVDENTLISPVQIFSSDEVLLAEFGEQKRRTLSFQEIPYNVKYAFLAAEDDSFFEHEGFRLLSFARALFQIIQQGEIVSGGGTITMQVVRGYLLSRDQNVVRKLKEIYLAFELESMATKEEIFELYINTFFFGNRSYGVQAAAQTYFSKNVDQLTLAEAAIIAGTAQRPSDVNPIRSPERAVSRRNWILKRMYSLGYIGKGEYLLAKMEPLNVKQDIFNFEVDARYFAEVIRQSLIDHYGLRVYKEGWKVFSTLDSELQNNALAAQAKNLLAYDKRQGWREPKNINVLFTQEDFAELAAGRFELLFENLEEDAELGSSNSLIAKLRTSFDTMHGFRELHKGLVVDIKPRRVMILKEDLNLVVMNWDENLQWARKRISIDSFGPRPQNFYDVLKLGDLIFFKSENDQLLLEQMPVAESAIVSLNPKSGAIKTYIGGINFTNSNFDRVRISYPQTGSSFKPFIYAAAFNAGYSGASVINDAPIIFEDKNLESYWRPENYTKKFYGDTRLREALIQSINIVTVKLLREIGIDETRLFLNALGFDESRLNPDLSLALGSSSFSPLEMARAYSLIANLGNPINPYFIERIEDRHGNVIFDHKQMVQESVELIFPWISNSGNQEDPFQILPELSNPKIDPRVFFLVKDILKEALKRGTSGRKTKILDRDDIGGKTGTTNDAISTWFSGFSEELVTTIWVGTDDFSSLGKNEFGSSIALPTWVDFMEESLDIIPERAGKVPAGVSYIRVNRDTGQPTKDISEKSYFEISLD
ncbi:MAG: transglycosylase domain-containing protein [Gammaproteobacteria bacterium]